MADRTFFDINSPGNDVTLVAGSFAPNAGAALDDDYTYGDGFTVVRTSAGKFTITFDDTYPTMLAAIATLQLATVDDKYCIVGAYTAASKTLVIYTYDISGGAVSDVAANANNRVNFVVAFSNTSA